MTVADEAVELNASLILERRNIALEEWEELGITRHDMPEEERAEWANALEDIPGNWIGEIEGEGTARPGCYGPATSKSWKNWATISPGTGRADYRGGN